MSPKFTKFRWQSLQKNPNKQTSYQVREKTCLKSVIDWKALQQSAETVRNVRCKVGEQYCFGGRHAVREIVFEDDVHWIARVQLPDVNPDASEKYVPKPVGFGWTKQRHVENAAKMQSEIDTMGYIREMTEIPVPRVFFAETGVDNPVGAPYMFMECIKGNSGLDMPGSIEVPKKYAEKFLAVEAAMTVKIWNLKFDKIGSIYKTAKGQYEIGPLADGTGGPFETATEYYEAWAAKNKTTSGATSDLVSRIETVAPIISKHDKGPFRLIHPDFGLHNVMVDDKYNIVGIIDWEDAFVGPTELAAQQTLRHTSYPIPVLDTIPGFTDKRGKVINKQLIEAFQQKDKFIAAVAAKEQEVEFEERMSTNMVCVQADIWWLIYMWGQQTPWLYTYNHGVEKGIDVIFNNLREAAVCG